MAVAVEFLSVGDRQFGAGNLRERLRRGIEQDSARRGQVVEGSHERIAEDFSAESLETTCQGVGDRLGTALGERPARVVTGDAEHDADRGGEGRIESLDAVGRVAGEEGAAFLRSEAPAREGFTRAHGRETELDEEKRVTRGKGERS